MQNLLGGIFAAGALAFACGGALAHRCGCRDGCPVTAHMARDARRLRKSQVPNRVTVGVDALLKRDAGPRLARLRSAGTGGVS